MPNEEATATMNEERSEGNGVYLWYRCQQDTTATQLQPPPRVIWFVTKANEQHSLNVRVKHDIVREFYSLECFRFDLFALTRLSSD